MITWKNIDDDEIPDSQREVVALSPEGVGHITSWRGCYDIFCCQAKREDSYGWKWAYLHN